VAVSHPVSLGRHGRTARQTAGRVCSRLDAPVDETGDQEAVALRTWRIVAIPDR
jgi:broad specificity phosphatase PhoE